MATPPVVVALGEALVLFEPGIGTLSSASTFHTDVVGAELNVCVALARLGLAVQFCTRVGDDPLGERILHYLQASDIDSDAAVIDPDHPTGLILREASTGRARKVFYYRSGSAAAAIDLGDVRSMSVPSGAFVVSGVTMALGTGPSRAALAGALAAREAGAEVAFDPNLRPKLGGLSAIRQSVMQILPMTTVLSLGLDEAKEILGGDEPAEIRKRALDFGIREVVIHDGERGCWFDDGSTMLHAPAVPSAVVDTVGAGDAFLGAYLGTRLLGGDRAAAAWMANRFAARVTEAVGDTAGLPGPGEATRLLAHARSTSDRVPLA